MPPFLYRSLNFDAATDFIRPVLNSDKNWNILTTLAKIVQEKLAVLYSGIYFSGGGGGPDVAPSQIWTFYF